MKTHVQRVVLKGVPPSPQLDIKFETLRMLVIIFYYLYMKILTLSIYVQSNKRIEGHYWYPVHPSIQSLYLTLWTSSCKSAMNHEGTLYRFVKSWWVREWFSKLRYVCMFQSWTLRFNFGREITFFRFSKKRLNSIENKKKKERLEPNI